MAQDPRALLQKADKLLASASGGFSFFSNKQDKIQDAADTYQQAGNAFRLQKDNLEAGKAFEKAAAVFKDRLNEPSDAANCYLEAFKVFRKDDPRKAVDVLQNSISHYCNSGSWRRAATHMENKGEVLENELGDKKGAMGCYEEAATWYEGDNASALANKLWLKVADLAALEGDYYKAIDNYEKVADSSLGNNLMRYSVKEYFLKAGICALATKDLVATKRNLDRYIEKDPSFASQREYQLLSDLTAAVEDNNQEQFTEKLFAYDQMSRLDQWKTEILVRVKNNIEEADNEFS